MTTATKPAAAAPTAETIVRGFTAWANLTLGGMVEHTEDIARKLNTPQERSLGERDAKLEAYQRADAEARAQIYPSLAAVAAPKMYREKLALDLSDMVMDGQRSIQRWLSKQRQQALVAKNSVAPSPDATARAQSLSSVPADELLRQAEAYVKADQPEEADVFLRAAQLGGQLRADGPSTSFGVLRRITDAALDTVQPHRVAASQQAQAAQDSAEAAMAVIAEFQSAARALMQSDPSDPSEAVAAAKALIARHQ